MGKGTAKMKVTLNTLVLSLLMVAPLSARASDIVNLRSCSEISRTAARVQEVEAGQLVDFVFQSRSALLYPIVSIEWQDARGEVYRQEQKLDEIRGGQNFFTVSIPNSFVASSMKILVNDQHCFQAPLKVSAQILAQNQSEDTSTLFFSVRPKVSPLSMLMMSLLLSLGLLAMVPKRKTYLLKRKLALPE